MACKNNDYAASIERGVVSSEATPFFMANPEFQLFDVLPTNIVVPLPQCEARALIYLTTCILTSICFNAFLIKWPHF